MNNDWSLSYEQNMAQLLNHMDAINKISPMINVETVPDKPAPNQCLYVQEKIQNESWYEGYTFSKQTSSESIQQPMIVVDEAHESDESPDKDESLEAFLNILEDDTFLTSGSLLSPDDHPALTASDLLEITEIDVFDSGEPSTPSTFLDVEKPSRAHARRGSFSTVEQELLYVQPQQQPQERPRSPKRTRRNSFSDLEELEARGVEDELEGIKKCKFD
jgi:hypothetical protein